MSAPQQQRIGLLPFYLKLYDKSFANLRPRIEHFYNQIAAALRKRGIETRTAPVCRLKSEFTETIKAFEKAKVDALVTLHLAYSPSLESAEALANTALPIIVLDTTPTYDFGPRQTPDEIMYNHGIHGVQDMCNLLIRNGKPFKIEAGHWQKSDVLKRVTTWVRSARMASAMRHARVGRIGKPFKGMGDFAVPTDALKRTMGVETVPCDVSVIRRWMSGISHSELELEMAANRKQFIIRNLNAEAQRQTARVSLAVRRWIEKERLTAFTVNFLAVNKASGLPMVPFVEACRAMVRGLGYAGEGDVLTAALVGALASAYPDTTFTEMFCPDWKGNRIFLSHMGEVNPHLLTGKPCLSEMPFSFTDAWRSVCIKGCLRGGKAVFVNLAPLSGRRYRLIVAPVTLVEVKGEDKMADTIHGWFKPQMPIADFLAEYSRVGGTHHAALVYGTMTREIMGFGHFMGWETVVLS